MVTVTALMPVDLERVDRHLPLNRLDQHLEGGSTYLVAWDGELPVGHALIAWRDTHLGLPELQDVFVSPTHRRHGIATTLTRTAEETVRAHGQDRISLSVSQAGNPGARRLYAGLDYVDAGVAPVRVNGVIVLRGEPFHADDTLVYLARTSSRDPRGGRTAPRARVRTGRDRARGR